MRFQWHWDFKFLLLVCAVLPLTISAGFWQLDRAEQKRTNLAMQDLGAAQPAINLQTEGLDSSQNYLKVFAEGEWSEELFLLDNRIRSSRVGYEVVGVLRVSGLPALLVNRGWVKGDTDRKKLPEITQPFGAHRVEGYLYRSAQKPMVLSEQTWQQQWPELLQVIDFELMEARLGEELYPAVLRINKESPLAFRADWVIERKGPGMHIGYAVQWFLMALTIFIMTIFANSNLWKWLKNRNTSANS